MAGGRFSVLRPLGRGGMGALYLASDHSAFDRPVVIKALLPLDDPADEVESREQFLSEARMLARLKYPTIPQIFAHFSEGPHTCIVMEYIEGRDLLSGLTHYAADGTQIPGHAYPQAEVMRWGIDLCRLLEYLARQQPPIMHQDIKPANLMLDHHSADLFLVDFGAVRSHRLGAIRTAFGTPGYAPPEQYQGRGEPRSDVYALAATLYHLATDDDPANQPFVFPQLDQLGPLGAALRPALRRNPADRPDAAGLRAALEALHSNPAQSAPLKPSPPPAPAAPITPRGMVVAGDGSALRSPRELVTWGEQHWEAFGRWLAAELPTAITQAWADPQLDQRVQTAMSTPGSRDAWIDAVLAACDPRGFGAALPQLDADTRRLSYGAVAGHERRWLILRNSGRRYIEGEIRLPAILIADQSRFRLSPGEHVVLTIDALTDHLPVGRQLSEEVAIVTAGRVLLRIPVTLEVAQPSILSGPLRGNALWIIGMASLAVIAIALFIVFAS